MLLAPIKLVKMVEAHITDGKPGMKASLMSHIGVTTLVITSMGNEIKVEVLDKNIWGFAWMNNTQVGYCRVVFPEMK